MKLKYHICSTIARTHQVILIGCQVVSLFFLNIYESTLSLQKKKKICHQSMPCKNLEGNPRHNCYYIYNPSPNECNEPAQRKSLNFLHLNKSYFEQDDGGPVSHPPLYSWEDVVCHLISVLTGVVCAAMSVKYISQLGNVGKLTPVQCLTNHIIQTSLHIH